MTLEVRCSILVPGVGSLELENRTAGYNLEASTREEYAVTWRKQEVTNPFVEGSYIVSAVRENVTENISVWVRGRDYEEMDNRVERLLRLVEHLRYQVTYSHNNISEVWDCQTANYSVRTQREYQHATLALVKLQIPRLPRVTRYRGLSVPHTVTA